MHRRIALILFVLLLWCTRANAVDFYNDNVYSPQPMDMFRYGDTQTSLFTGKTHVSVPIYTLQDPDFDLTIALQYNAEGFKPRKHAGAVGYNWFLQAGGCIIREVKNYADEANYYDTRVSKQVRGMYTFCKSYQLNREDVFNFSSNLYYNELSSLYLDPAQNGRSDNDYLPDIFHFNFCGYTGSFMINNAGKAVILHGDYLDVDLSGLTWNSHHEAYTLPLPDTTSTIMVRTLDGYTYVFGGSLSSVEYSVAAKDGKTLAEVYPPTINVWHLCKIIAPNQRTIQLYYKPVVRRTASNEPAEYDPLWELNEYHNMFSSSHSTMEYNMNKTCRLDSIVVSGVSPLKISFEHSIAVKQLYDYSSCYVLSKNHYQLDRIIVTAANRTIKQADLTYTYQTYRYNHGNADDSHNWRFLSSVRLSGEGTYQFSYDNRHEYPRLSNPLSDYYQEADLYDYWRTDPLQGMLKTIVYPTGGKQVFTYGKNKYSTEYRYETVGSYAVKLATKTFETDSVGYGVRIEKVETYDGDELVERKTYSYNKENGSLSSGILYNRRMTYEVGNNIVVGTFISEENNYSMIDPIVGYSYVEEITYLPISQETNKVTYNFSTGSSSTYNIVNSGDVKSPVAINQLTYNPYVILSGMLAYDRQLSPIGHIINKTIYKNDAVLLTQAYQYNGVVGGTQTIIPETVTPILGRTDTIVIFSHFFTPITRKIYVCPDVLNQFNETYTQEGQQKLSIDKHYQYDHKLRIKRETIENSDGITYFSKYRYVDDIVGQASLTSTNPYHLLCTRHQLLPAVEVVSGYVNNGTDYVTTARVNKYTTGTSTRSGMLPYPYISSSWESHIPNGIDTFSVCQSNNSIHSSYRLKCEYEYDDYLRLTKEKPYGTMPTTYVWDGIYPTMKIIGNQTYLYTYIPYIGIQTVTDPRGITTYYEYDSNGRLIEIYRLNNNRKEIIQYYQYHIQSEEQ